MGRRGNLNMCVEGNIKDSFLCVQFLVKILLKILINVGCTNDTFFLFSRLTIVVISFGPFL